MWHEFDGEHLRFTHTTKRGKYRNLQQNPAMSYLVFDPADPMIYVEVRGDSSRRSPIRPARSTCFCGTAYAQSERPCAARRGGPRHPRDERGAACSGALVDFSVIGFAPLRRGAAQCSSIGENSSFPSW